MKNIAIVEDEDLAAEKLIEYIHRYEKENDQTFRIERFTNALDFLTNYQAIYAVVFMDIQMPKLNGMDGAVQLRKVDKSVSLIFITNLVQFAQKGYEVDAICYLLKPVSFFDFSLKFKKALDVYVKNEDKSIMLNLPGGACRISSDELMYVEIVSHRLYYHMIDGDYEMTGTLSTAEKNLSEYGFLRCNNCYLVNPKFVVSVNGYDVVVGNKTLQVSRLRKAGFLAALANWYAGKKE